jgi:hypothetical protein
MLGSEGCIEAVLRDEISAVSAALCPGAMICAPVVVAILLQGCMTLPSSVTCPSPLLLPHSGLFLSARRWLLETLRLLRLLRLLMLRLCRRAALLLPGPFMVLSLLLLFALDRLLWDLGTLWRLGLMRLGLLGWPSLLGRNLRPLFPVLRFRTRRLLRRLYRLRLLWLLWRLRPRVPLLRRQMLLLLGSRLSRTWLLAVWLLLVLCLGWPLLPIFLFVFLLLTEGRNRRTEGKGQCSGPYQVKHSLLCHFHT